MSSCSGNSLSYAVSYTPEAASLIEGGNDLPKTEVGCLLAGQYPVGLEEYPPGCRRGSNNQPLALMSHRSGNQGMKRGTAALVMIL